MFVLRKALIVILLIAVISPFLGGFPALAQGTEIDELSDLIYEANLAIDDGLYEEAEYMLLEARIQAIVLQDSYMLSTVCRYLAETYVLLDDNETARAFLLAALDVNASLGISDELSGGVPRSVWSDDAVLESRLRLRTSKLNSINAIDAALEDPSRVGLSRAMLYFYRARAFEYYGSTEEHDLERLVSSMGFIRNLLSSQEDGAYLEFMIQISANDFIGIADLAASLGFEEERAEVCGYIGLMPGLVNTIENYARYEWEYPCPELVPFNVENNDLA